jgi:hypothetical protein
MQARKSKKLGRLAKRVASSAAAVSILTAGLLTATAGSAHADPFNCSAYFINSKTTAALCRSGSGTYRAVASCSYLNTAYYFSRSGSTVRVGQISRAYCPAGSYARNYDVQIVSLN